MKHYILLGAAAFLSACSGGNTGEASKPVDPAKAVYDCPKDKWLANADYADDAPAAMTDLAAWHETNGARKSVITAESGLQYKVVQKGLADGATPIGDQKVEMHYHGFFPNGKIFDSSIERNETMVHNANGFIKGWNESLAEMKVCEARVLYIPANLAYGDRGAPGAVPPNASLLFHMQLLGVKK